MNSLNDNGKNERILLRKNSMRDDGVGAHRGTADKQASNVSTSVLRRALCASAAVSLLAVLFASVGWRVFEFDAALLPYAVALIVTLGLTCYRFTVWLHRPPTLHIYQRAIAHLRRMGVTRAIRLVGLRAVRYFAFNSFIWQRSPQRWAAHLPVLLGCLMAFAIVVPLIFGWVWFETPPDDFESYRVMLFGQHIRTIGVDSWEAFFAFHGLVWAALFVTFGASVAVYRRLTDGGEKATQTFGYDIVPLVALLSISITGLLLTASYTWLGGWGHAWLAKTHMVIVVVTLVSLPFGKLFHIPQRTLKLAHMVCEASENSTEPAICARCGDEFASLEQVEDLILVQQRLGYRYEMSSSKTGDHYQHICPRCRRATLVIAQGQRWSDSAKDTLTMAGG